MSLRDITHQADIELGRIDTEYVTRLKDERADLYREGVDLVNRDRLKPQKDADRRLAEISYRLARIEELLA